MTILNDHNHPARHEELPKSAKKTAYCRCWKSKKMPFCDGAHREYNALSGDNLGPLVIQWNSCAE